VVTEPQILRVRHEAGSVRATLKIPANLPCLAGHFPGVPIVPGVMLLEWALDLARRELPLPPIFKRLSAVKFMRIMPLDREIELDLQHSAGELAFEYFDAGRSCVQGRVLFADA